ncbi:MAG: ABC transporter permease [Roseburia sp.]
MYESKASIRSEFEQFQKMFFLLGGVLCAIIGLVGVLNFFNAIMTGILARKREFAVLQSVGMTNRQLKQMLVQEGLFYTAGSVVVAFLLSLVCGPLSGDMMEKMFWFCTYHFTILPVIAMLPVFAVLGCLIPRGTLSGEKQTEYCGTAAGGRVKKMKILEDIGIRYAGIFFFYIKEIIAKKYKKV